MGRALANSHTFEIAIIGGGAAGLTSAIFAAEAAPGRNIAVLDGAKVLGAKILVSGGGRCNVTHREVKADDFNGSKNIVRNVLAAFDEQATVRWFESLGVSLKLEPTGKLFPIADSSRAVLNALLHRCEQLGVVLQTQSRVTNVVANDGGFTVDHERGRLTARKVILTTGGRSLPRSGSDGFGWTLAKQLGHTVTPTYAALVPLVLAPTMFHVELSGIAMDVELATLVAGKRIDVRTGSLLWTHLGISGPVVMDASRHWTMAHETGQQPTMVCNLLPGRNFEQAEAQLINAIAARPKATMLTHLNAMFPERVAIVLLKHAGIDPAAVAGQLPRDDRRKLVHSLVALPLPVTGHRGWNYAEVTAGGVPLGEIDYRTMQSRKTPGLHLAGEILDCDGRIGGFNFQWAWATGYLAGRGAASEACAQSQSLNR